MSDEAATTGHCGEFFCILGTVCACECEICKKNFVREIKATYDTRHDMRPCPLCSKFSDPEPLT